MAAHKDQLAQLSPNRIYDRAERETLKRLNAGDLSSEQYLDALRLRYRELMIEAGHLIEGTGEPKKLPCGWPR